MILVCFFFIDDCILIIYVDDVLGFDKSKNKLKEIFNKIKKKGMIFTEEGEEEDVFSFLGIEIRKSEDGKKVEMLQKGLTEKVIKAVGLEDSNSKSTPAASTVPIETDPDGAEMVESWAYPSIVGMLMYLASNSRPDIQFSTHQCARFTHCFKQSHANAIKRIVRYLLGTKDKGLLFDCTKELNLDCYVDADFAGLWRHEDDQDPVCVKSRTGFVITLGGFPVVWTSKLQELIALSTLEAEYIALSTSMRELIPLHRLVKEIERKIGKELEINVTFHSTVFEDNDGVLVLASSPRMSPRTKYIAVKYHWFREYIGENKYIVLKRIATDIQKADILTKGLKEVAFVRIRKLLCGW